ncbi:MAG TPA: helix-hairpin-helix domain-containing protein, partial [Saprospiraceae bacterium]|nr:helix-hairpin-helix domain-containing protein [Saprospiraceae bacterium]
RICLIVFVGVLLGWELIKYVLPPPVFQPAGDFENKTFADLMQSPDSTNRDRRYSPKEYEYNQDREDDQYQALAAEEDLQPVEIMHASWKELRAIGFSSKVASNIERYIAAGGVVRNEKDLLKIYGMDTAQWNAVSSLIIFPETKSEPDYPEHASHKEKISTAPLDLNTITATELESLPGIGTVLAERIIKYRTSLGGYCHVDQLKECYGLPPETFEKIMPRLTITQPPSTIAINHVDFTNFNHPYLNKKMIRLLQAYKAQHGPFTDATDLRKIYPPDSTWCDRLLPYINFD